MKTRTRTWLPLLLAAGVFSLSAAPAVAGHRENSVKRHVQRWLAKGHQPQVRTPATGRCPARVKDHRPDVRHGNRDGRGRGAVTLPPVCSTRRCTEVFGRNPVIRRTDPLRRVIQPRVHGHKAYIQARRSRRDPWVTISAHPSIW
jgi:hypothetical protein